MARNICFVLVTLLICSSLSGCLFSDDDASDIVLIISHDNAIGTIVETYSEGEFVSLTPVTVNIDFSETTSTNPLQTFGIESDYDREPITVDAITESTISVTFNSHGIYQLSAYAEDSLGNKINQSITVRVDLRIDWTETDTNAPRSLPFNPEPDNQGQHPKMIEIISNVENPSLVNNIGDSGQSVQLTWQLVDELDDICQTRNGQINDGDVMMWQTLYFNTYMLHELRIEMDEGQDSVNVNQSVAILYDN
ncbi:MAG TPA: hypothetical protein HA354_07595 [Candidatus Poseidoniaceae archaeon]|nr:hypothetical protein [Euryarchaeota archaeon]DAC56151.1 MAG TPA: hypothetical protein D7I07_07595 [Candidatus Poseidoniales archaeon]HII38349.1 hypothetical protein [Candidatus Poseidoniaceae archaeon]|tara:strand:+ start:1042 stop:1794 length:753 start_codon:yes stop_codon:yes gene_type:complete